ncbi:MAG: hypothetical protein AAGN35_23810 [Bacteroidota bacterium]
MKPEIFFWLVHDLTEEERYNYSKFMKGRKKTLTYNLYQRVIQNCADSFSKQLLKKIKGRKFKDAAMFCIYRDNVTESILMSIVQSQNPTFPVVTLIKEAAVRGAIGYAEKIFAQEVKTLEKHEDYPGLLIFHHLADRLQSEYDISLQQPENGLKIAEIRRRADLHQKLDAGLELTRKMALERIEQEIELVSNLANQTYQSRINQDLALRLNRNLAFLQEDFSRAFALGETLVRRLIEWNDRYPVLQIASALRFNALGAAYLNERDLAQRYCLQLSALQPQLNSERNVLLKSIIKVNTAVCLRTVDHSFLLKTWHLLQSSESVFNSALVVAKLYHSLGLCFLKSQNYLNAIQCFERVRTMQSKIGLALQWECRLMLAVSHFESGNLGAIEGLLRSSYRQARLTKLRYPKLACQAFRDFYAALESDQRFILQRYIDRLEEVLSDRDERHASRTVQFENWLEAKLHRIPLAEIITRKQDEDKNLKNFFQFA